MKYNPGIIVRARKVIITFAVLACLCGLYVVAYFGSVERVLTLGSQQVVNKGGAAPYDPQKLVVVTSSGYSPVYSLFSAEFFKPVHYIDQKLIRPHFWLKTQTEQPVRVVY